ncbi:MAG: 1-acyl-sn-glycerol-3-phosphate acyltransferase [Chthonomonadales bacterium]|nr:1-acyl-sn-glycerol-3-phosphate acyltransferase [Chthonomonadales bacterium]
MLYAVVRSVALLAIRAVLAWSGGLRVTGVERVPARGGVIVAPNHLSHADPGVIGLALPRRAWFMATSELFEVRGLAWLARLLRAFPVRQDEPDRAALRRTEALLRGGEAVVVFPEGHESVTGRMQSVQGGLVLLAIRTGTPVVPVAIEHTETLMPPRTFRLRRIGRPVTVHFGKPIAATELAGGLRGREAVRHGTGVLQAAIEGLLDPRYRSGGPADARPGPPPPHREGACPRV